jgi:ketoreductase RED1
VIPNVELDAKLQQVIIDQAAASFGKRPIPEMERKRDDSQLAILHALATIPTQGEPPS